MKLWGISLGLVMIASLATLASLEPAVAAAPERNACGCYKDGADTCFCDKKAKCGCPGECEPRGCEEQRDKELQKQIQEETRKAEASDHQRSSSGRPVPAREERPSARAGAHKMTAAQSRQLVKLLDLYLGEHPDARGRSIEDVRGDLSSAR